MKIKNNIKQYGFTLIELVMYIGGLLVLSSVIILLIVQFYSLYKEIVASPRADRTALLVIDRITKEIRSADQIDMVESQFNTTNGVLKISQIENNITTTKKFFVEDGVVKVQENTQEALELSSDDFMISNFNFKYFDTPVSEAVKFTMEIKYQIHNATTTKSYTGFAILRESYE